MAVILKTGSRSSNSWKRVENANRVPHPRPPGSKSLERRAQRVSTRSPGDFDAHGSLRMLGKSWSVCLFASALAHLSYSLHSATRPVFLKSESDQINLPPSPLPPTSLPPFLCHPHPPSLLKALQWQWSSIPHQIKVKLLRWQTKPLTIWPLTTIPRSLLPTRVCALCAQVVRDLWLLRDNAPLSEESCALLQLFLCPERPPSLIWWQLLIVLLDPSLALSLPLHVSLHASQLRWAYSTSIIAQLRWINLNCWTVILCGSLLTMLQRSWGG